MKAESAKQTNNPEGSTLDQSSFEPLALSFPLRIGYDGKRATNNLTGLGNYSRSLVAHLADRFPVHQYLFYTAKAKKNILQFPLFSKANISVKFPENGKLLWRSLGIKKQLQKDNIHIFHGLSHEIPVGLRSLGIKSIVTMHDLIYLRRPQYYNWIDRKIYELKSKYACKYADRIIAISERTKQDIVELFGTDPSKIDVIYQSCDDSFKTPKSAVEKQEIKEKYQLPAKYLLYVGTIEARKNLQLLIKALPHIASSYPLVIIGKATGYAEKVKQDIQKLGLHKRVIFLNSIPFFELPAIYQLSSCFILPSFYEGFGIPIIEALYGKVPVVAATGSCLEEAGGPNSIYISPTNSKELADAVNRVLGDEDLQTTMKEKGFEYVQRFNNEVVDQQMMDCYLKTLGHE